MSCFDGKELLYAASNGESYMCLGQNRACESSEDGFCGYLMGLGESLKNIRQDEKRGNLSEHISIELVDKGGLIDITRFYGPADDLYYSLDRFTISPTDFLLIATQLIHDSVAELNVVASHLSIGPTPYYNDGNYRERIEQGRLEGIINGRFELRFNPNVS